MEPEGRLKILVVLGEGGHTKEMLTLVDNLGEDLEYGYLMVDDDEVSASKVRRPGPVYRVRRPRDKKHALVLDAFKTLWSGWQAFGVLRSFRPTAVLSSGPSVAVPVCVIAKLMRVRVIFVETGSRVTALSMTGRILHRWADLMFVQWPELAEKLPRAVYAGRLL